MTDVDFEAGYEQGALDVCVLARLMSERAVLDGRPASFVRSEVERMQLELAFLASTDQEREEPDMAILDAVRKSRKDDSPVPAQIVSLEAAVARCDRDIEAADARHQRDRAALVDKRDGTAAKLDAARRRRLAECAAAWRDHARALRTRAERTGPDETMTIVRTGKPGLFMDKVRTPMLVMVRDYLLEQAEQAVTQSARLEAAAANETVAGVRLERCVAELTWPETDNGDSKQEQA